MEGAVPRARRLPAVLLERLRPADLLLLAAGGAAAASHGGRGAGGGWDLEIPVRILCQRPAAWTPLRRVARPRR